METKSLPPLVQGKVHGYLRLVIDEIAWCGINPGNVTVLASWWGELDSAHFRPVDVSSSDNRLEHDVTCTYAIRTNVRLFEEYLRNCESVQLVVVSDETDQVIGIARVEQLLHLLNGGTYRRYLPVVDDDGDRIGEVHLAAELKRIPPRSQRGSLAVMDNSEKKDWQKKMMRHNTPAFNYASTGARDLYENEIPLATKIAKESDIVHTSILKERRSNFGKSWKNPSSGVDDGLVARVVARARRLRGAILKEAQNDDPLCLSEYSATDSYRSDGSVGTEATLYEYFLGKKMSRCDEKRALEALRRTSPTPSLIDLASETIRTCRDDGAERLIATGGGVPSMGKEKATVERLTSVSRASGSTLPKELAPPDPIDYVDSLRVVVESLSLSPAGYRRVRSSCLSRGDRVPISVTYFVQYDASFGNTKKFNRKIIDNSRPVKLSSKRQVGQTIYFNHEAVYHLPETCLRADVPLKFTIFNRHLNQRTPTELGVGSMCVGDAAREPSLSSTQRIAIVNKGIKIGELRVAIELGCDMIHFGKQFVEAVVSAKENIPVLEASSMSTLGTGRCRGATGGESVGNDGSRTSAGTSEATRRNAGVSATRRNMDLGDKHTGDGMFAAEAEADAGDPGGDDAERVLLHGLIHIAEGKDLSSRTTYLICRAFWPEDRAVSRVCVNTDNPAYNFHQSVPLIHGPELLERTRDNYIVVEVYSGISTGGDTVERLVGISKLSVHQLYVAYRDQRILPHLLRSKYPVISVDGWVSIDDPVTGNSRGRILALVALGTADQIALLETTRGLRDTHNTTDLMENHSRPSHRSTSGNREFHVEPDYSDSDPLRTQRASNYRDARTQECQTEITTVSHLGPPVSDEYPPTNDNPQSQVLNAIVGRLAQALSVPRPSADRAAQTDASELDRSSFNNPDESGQSSSRVTDVRGMEPPNLEPSTNNSFSGENSEDGRRDSFHLTREIYRSVGVGAEFDDSGNQCPAAGHNAADPETLSLFEERDPRTLSIRESKLEEHPLTDSEEAEFESTSFHVVIEIERALHLPRVEKPDEAVEPCTYVTLRTARNISERQCSSGQELHTDVCPFSCSPKWDWKCDTRLSAELLNNDEKRLVLKVWRLSDPETSMRINFERDVVIGFSAIDLSVLTVGFPVVSGWFHVMDFSGKCNGQIKVSVRPLDNTNAIGKAAPSTSVTTRLALPELDCPDFTSSYPAWKNSENNAAMPNSSRGDSEHLGPSSSRADNEPSLDLGLGLGEASMSFLSLSLKQKLTELDEIKKRLQSRLRDVTTAAFEDDLDIDFDMPIAENEVGTDGNGNSGVSRDILRDIDNWQIPRELVTESPDSPSRSAVTNGHPCRSFSDHLENHRVRSESNSASADVDANFTDTGYSTSSNALSGENMLNGNRCCIEIGNSRCRSRLPGDESGTNGLGSSSILVTNPNLANGHCERREFAGPSETNVRNFRNFRNYRPSDRDCDEAGKHETMDRSNGTEDHPIRGTRMHINHLLDRLSSQLGAVPPPSTGHNSLGNNIIDLMSSLGRNNNNFPNDLKCNREANVRTVPTQTETNYHRDSRVFRLPNDSSETRTSRATRSSRGDRGEWLEETETPAKAQRRDKLVSTVIREELAADESNDCCTRETDELSAHLMTSNVRHMNLDSIINPLIYPHLIPDIGTSTNGLSVDLPNSTTVAPATSGTSEAEVIERLDTRYTENFNSAINNGLSRLRNLIDSESSSRNSALPDDSQRNENGRISRATPSGISESVEGNVDGNIDVTVIHKPCNDDLMASNSLESTTTISLDNELQTGTEIDDNSSLDSSETSVPAVSRQAPDGGNPIEDANRPSVINQPADDSQDSSTTS